MCERILGNAQIGLLQVLERQPGVLMQLRRNGVQLRIGQRVPFRQSRGEPTERILAHLIQKRLESRRLMRQGVVVPRRGRVTRQIHGVGTVVPGQLREDSFNVGGHGDEDQAVEGHIASRTQVIRNRRGARRAVTLTQQIFRRGPAIAVAHILRNEARDGIDVRVDAPELLVLVLADRVTEAGADRIDHHQVALVEHAEFVVHRTIRSGRGRARIGDDDTLRTQHPHVQPHRRGARAAVEREHDGTLARVPDVAFRIRDEADVGERLVLVVADHERSGGRGVVDRLAVDGNAVRCGGALRVRQAPPFVLLVALHIDLARLHQRGRGGAGGVCPAGDTDAVHRKDQAKNQARDRGRLPHV